LQDESPIIAVAVDHSSSTRQVKSSKKDKKRLSEPLLMSNGDQNEVNQCIGGNVASSSDNSRAKNINNRSRSMSHTADSLETADDFDGVDCVCTGFSFLLSSPTRKKNRQPRNYMS
jgi:hypothetical protein